MNKRNPASIIDQAKTRFANKQKKLFISNAISLKPRKRLGGLNLACGGFALRNLNAVNCREKNCGIRFMALRKTDENINLDRQVHQWKRFQ